jgi:hypothetical protein
VFPAFCGLETSAQHRQYRDPCAKVHKDCTFFLPATGRRQTARLDSETMTQSLTPPKKSLDAKLARLLADPG